MPKISQLPQDSAPTVTDKIPMVDTETSTTKYALLSDLITTIFANATGANSPVTRQSENQFDYVVQNTGIWTADSVGANRNASMSALTAYINGRRITISLVSARTFTASKDTYIDLKDNLDGTGTIVYTEVSNNAASPALAANSLRIGIIVTGATTIAATGSINQGQEDRILPIRSSIPMAVTDELGNLICPRDPNRTLLGYRQILTTFTLSSAQTTPTQVTGLTCPIIVPAGRKVKISGGGVALTNANANSISGMQIWDGVVNSGTLIQETDPTNATAAGLNAASLKVLKTPSSTSKTYNAGILSNTLNNVALQAGANTPAFIMVELE